VKSVLTLALAQCFSATGTAVVVLLGGILGATLAPTPLLATLPASLQIVGVALTTIPAALFMQRFGRKRGFILSAASALLATLLASFAVARGSFALLCLSTALIGMNNAFSLQYRFAAAEFVAPEKVGKAVGLVMVGTLVAAWLGPTLALQSRHLIRSTEFAGSFLATSGLYVIAIAILARLPDAGRAHVGLSGGGRPLREILAQPLFRVAVAASLLSYAVMSFIMTATPISMHLHDHHSVDATGSVIKGHLIAMYLPALVSGWLVSRFGVRTMMLVGIATMAGCIAVAAFLSREALHYGVSLVLLGAGWNLLFVSGTTLLTCSYRPEERFRAQGFNDFLTFGCQATVSLLAGVAVAAVGWRSLNLIALPLLAVMLLLIVSQWRPLRSAIQK
jgi:MFS family permease